MTAEPTWFGRKAIRKYDNPDGDEGPCVEYYLKRTDIERGFAPEWQVDPDKEQACVKCVLELSDLDCRGKKINELAIMIARQVSGATPTFDRVEMFSRITFDTESMGGTKDLIVEYYLFS
jgi:hypothetical protein